MIGLFLLAVCAFRRRSLANDGFIAAECNVRTCDCCGGSQGFISGRAKSWLARGFAVKFYADLAVDFGKTGGRINDETDKRDETGGD